MGPTRMESVLRTTMTVARVTVIASGRCARERSPVFVARFLLGI